MNHIRHFILILVECRLILPYIYLVIHNNSKTYLAISNSFIKYINHLFLVMNVVIVHDCMIKEQALNVDISAVIVDLLVQPIISVVGLGVINLQEVEMIRCIIDTIDIRIGHIQRSVVL